MPDENMEKTDDPWKDFYGKVDQAHAKAAMLKESCKGMKLAGLGENYQTDWTWFEGAEIVCCEIRETLGEVLDFVNSHQSPYELADPKPEPSTE